MTHMYEDAMTKLVTLYANLKTDKNKILFSLLVHSMVHTLMLLNKRCSPLTFMSAGLSPTRHKKMQQPAFARAINEELVP